MKTVYRLIELRRLGMFRSGQASLKGINFLTNLVLTVPPFLSLSAPFFPYVEDEDAGIDAEECPICLNVRNQGYMASCKGQTLLVPSGSPREMPISMDPIAKRTFW
jgi:hypothetical protein